MEFSINSAWRPVQHHVHDDGIFPVLLHNPPRNGRHGECPVSVLTSANRRGFTHASLVVISLLVGAAMGRAAPVTVRHTEGVTHGFLVLRTLEGMTIADGDLIQFVRGFRVTSRLVFHFKDGSTHDETAIFSQRSAFRLISYRLVQKGPTFPRPMEMSINVGGGEVVVRYADHGGDRKDESLHDELPPDLANGAILTLLKNIGPNGSATLSYVAATPKPRVVKLNVTTAGEERFTTGGQSRTATHYVLKVDIGGLAGLVAPLVGKQPPDSHVWMLGGDAPTFVKSELSLYLGGPMWRIELVSPTWPGNASGPPH